MSITKGKWEAIENDHFIDIKVHGNPIAQVIVNQYADVDKGQMRANARMMALAPEMADMLKELSSLMPMLDEQTHPNIECDALKYDIDELLAKVKGDL